MKQLDLIIRTLKAVSDQNRVRILFMLNEKSLCVCEISAVLKLAQPTVSKHLKQLKDAELISEIKDGKWVNYSLNKELSKDSFIKKTLQLIIDNKSNDRRLNADKEILKIINREELSKK